MRTATPDETEESCSAVLRTRLELDTFTVLSFFGGRARSHCVMVEEEVQN